MLGERLALLLVEEEPNEGLALGLTEGDLLGELEGL